MTENELLLKMAKAFQESKAWPALSENKTAIYLAKVALDASPGMADVAAGKAVIVPVEATEEMLISTITHRSDMGVGIDEPWQFDPAQLYREWIAATPYRNKVDE
jgi:hypothetical protein